MSNLETLVALGKMRKVHIFEHGGLSLNYRGLSNQEKTTWRDAALDASASLTSDNLLIAMALCHADGTPLFETDDARQGAMVAISAFDPVEVAKPLIDRILMASGIGKSAEAAATKN